MLLVWENKSVIQILNNYLGVEWGDIIRHTIVTFGPCLQWAHFIFTLINSMPKPQRNGIKIFRVQICFEEPGIWSLKMWRTRSGTRLKVLSNFKKILEQAELGILSNFKTNSNQNWICSWRVRSSQHWFKKTQKFI